MKLFDILKAKGYNVQDTENMSSYITEYLQWYKGNVPKFQRYYIYNGNKKNWFTRKTLNMPKKVCEDFANFLMNEKVEINVGSKNNTKAFNEILDKLNFHQLVNSGIEKSFALGTGALVCGMQDLTYDGATIRADKDSKLILEFVEANKIIPLTYNQNEITECAFATNKTMNGVKLLYLQIHRLATDKDREENTGLTKDNYIIENMMFKVANSGDLTDITDQFEDTIRILDTGSTIPWFSIIKPNITNNINLESPFGLSVFANSLDVIKGIDIAYDSFVNEFLLGRKRLFVKSDLMQVDTTTGEMKYVFDPNESVYHQIPMGSSSETDIIENESSLRIAEHESGIQVGLNLLSSKLGMGTNHYLFDKGSVQTATQIISENSDLYNTISKHEIALRQSLTQIIKAIIYISSLIGTKIDGDITIDFDDSIIQDTDAERERSYKEFSNGMIDLAQYFVETRNMTRKQAEKFIEGMNKPLSQLQTGNNLGVIDRLELRKYFYPNESDEQAQKKIQEIKDSEPTTRDLLGE